MPQKQPICDYDSSFEDDAPLKKRKINKEKSFPPTIPGTSRQKLPSPEAASRHSYKSNFCALSAYDKHILLVNQYLLYHPGATKLLTRDSSKDKTYFDVIRENHQFLWDTSSAPDEWGQKLAKKYYDKLFKEYCICDLSKYKENKVGMRWRSEKEVVEGKGQFICAEKTCSQKNNLRSWEMNFGYVEHAKKKNALVKLRVCHDCSYKVNFCKKRKEYKKSRKRKSIKLFNSTTETSLVNDDDTNPETESASRTNSEENIWQKPSNIPEEKSREDEFEEYLEDLFL